MRIGNLWLRFNYDLSQKKETTTAFLENDELGISIEAVVRKTGEDCSCKRSARDAAFKKAMHKLDILNAQNRATTISTENPEGLDIVNKDERAAVWAGYRANVLAPDGVCRPIGKRMTREEKASPAHQALIAAAREKMATKAERNAVLNA